MLTRTRYEVKYEIICGVIRLSAEGCVLFKIKLVELWLVPENINSCTGLF